MSLTATRAAGAGVSVSARPRDVLRTYVPLVAILAAAVVERHFVIGNADVTWLITACEKLLDGQRLYVDVFELNPPAAIFLYLPAVALARKLSLDPQIVVDAQVFLAAALSLAVASRIVRHCRLLDGAHGSMIAAFVLATLTILPAQTFGQREHLALIAALPVIATLTARAEGTKPLLWMILAAGLGAGATICIKPYFVLAIGLAAATAALQRRSWRVLFAAELWIAGGIAIVYAVCTIVFYRPFFTDLMPVLTDVYLPVRLPLLKLLIGAPVALWAAALLIILILRRGAGPQRPLAVLLSASAGFAAAYVIQGKGWPYHSLPMLALVLIALATAIGYPRPATAPERDRGRAKSLNAKSLGAKSLGAKSLGATAALGILAAASFAYLDIAVDTRAAIALVKQVAPPHPSIVAITADPAIGFPLVRAVDGRWISGHWGLWVTGNAATRRLEGGLNEPTRRRLAADVAGERTRLIGEIRDGKPDIILIDDRGPRWSEGVDGDRELSALIAANYREVGIADDIIVFKRDGTRGP
jgi:hypothetical protein